MNTQIANPNKLLATNAQICALYTGVKNMYTGTSIAFTDKTKFSLGVLETHFPVYSRPAIKHFAIQA